MKIFFIYFKGNFRFSHVNIRTNAESIAFYRGQEREHAVNNAYLNAVITNRWRIIVKNIFLHCMNVLQN